MIILVSIIVAAVLVMASGLWVALVLVDTIAKSPRRASRPLEGVQDDARAQIR